MKSRRSKALFLLCGIFAASCIVLLLAPFFGISKIILSDLFQHTASSTGSEVFWWTRVPRVLLAFLAGSALAVSGMTFQAMFRNPLATPFTLGTSSGASLGAALYVIGGFGWNIYGISGRTVFAFIGAMASILLVYGLTRTTRGISTATMLLAGVAVSFFFSSLLLFLQYISDFTDSFRIVRWLMGGVQTAGFDDVFNIIPFIACGALALFCMVHELNLLTTGEDLAASRGVDLKKTKRTLFFVTALMVGAVVAFCGPIGFVGMMAPHICRMLIGPNHRYLLPATFLFGGMFLTLCDTVGRTVIAPAEIPVGVITALLGGPFFIWLLGGKSVMRRGFF